jgi:penicillin-binding protein-related factor A (putative recombinase)
MTEKQIENEILNFLKTMGVFCWKNQSVGIFDPVKKVYRKSNNVHHIKGVADILGIIHGRFLAIEVKSETGSLTTEQKIFLKTINDEGGVAFVARSVEQTLLNLKQFFPKDDNIARWQKYAGASHKFEN